MKTVVAALALLTVIACGKSTTSVEVTDGGTVTVPVNPQITDAVTQAPPPVPVVQSVPEVKTTTETK